MASKNTKTKAAAQKGKQATEASPDVRLPAFVTAGKQKQVRPVDLQNDPTIKAGPLHSEHGLTRDEEPAHRTQAGDAPSESSEA